MNCADDIEKLWILIVVVWVVVSRVIKVMKKAGGDTRAPAQPADSSFTFLDDSYGEDEYGDDAIERELDRKQTEQDRQSHSVATSSSEWASEPTPPPSAQPGQPTWQQKTPPAVVVMPSRPLVVPGEERHDAYAVDEDGDGEQASEDAESAYDVKENAYARKFQGETAYGHALHAKTHRKTIDLDFSREGIRDAIILNEMLTRRR